MRNFIGEKQSAILLLSIGMLLLSGSNWENITADSTSDLTQRKDTIYFGALANMDMNGLFSS